jgi:hypothetical protein
MRMACDRGLELQREFHYAMLEKVSAEEVMGDASVGDFQARQNRLEAAKARVEAAWRVRTEHVAECISCFSDPPL